MPIQARFKTDKSFLEEMMDQQVAVPLWLNTIASSIITAIVVGLPLLYQLHKLRLNFKLGNIQVAEEERKHHVEEKVDNKWEELLKARVDELARLQLRDNQQEERITELFNKHVECRAQEAIMGERCRALETRVSDMQAQFDQRMAERDRLIIRMEEQLKYFEKRTS